MTTLQQELKKTADHYNEFIKDWKPEGASHKYFLEAIRKEAAKGLYHCRHLVGSRPPEFFLEEIRKEGLSIEVSVVDGKSLKTVDPDTYETIKVIYLNVEWS